ncbi:MAG: ribose 5-phosphate isomerase B [Bacteroidales bacterium]|jgi:ribose 5-phosphate isomerase B
MKIVVASDHAGYELKKHVVEYLKMKGYEVKDLGAFSDKSSDYPDFAHPLAETVERKEYEIGISLCGSGNGISIAANKHPGIRSAICWDVEIAKLARSHNNANICALPARFLNTGVAEKIVDAFLTTEFEGGRHQRRIDKIPIK